MPLIITYILKITTFGGKVGKKHIDRPALGSSAIENNHQSPENMFGHHHQNRNFRIDIEN